MIIMVGPCENRGGFNMKTESENYLIMRKINWANIQHLPSKSYTCGYCGSFLASERGYGGTYSSTSSLHAYVYICHKCYKATFFDSEGEQTPGYSIGSSVKFISLKEVEDLYEEARRCFSINAFTSSVMCCRKLLMNISASEGAKEGLSYAEYVSYLDTNNYIPPKGKEWVDKIRKLGNEANHSIEFKTKEDASLILNFTEMLLRFIYEMPGLMQNGGNGNNS